MRVCYPYCGNFDESHRLRPKKIKLDLGSSSQHNWALLIRVLCGRVFTEQWLDKTMKGRYRSFRNYPPLSFPGVGEGPVIDHQHAAHRSPAPRRRSCVPQTSLGWPLGRSIIVLETSLCSTTWTREFLVAFVIACILLHPACVVFNARTTAAELIDGWGRTFSCTHVRLQTSCRDPSIFAAKSTFSGRGGSGVTASAVNCDMSHRTTENVWRKYGLIFISLS